jgi:hypothetical protein
VWIIIAAMLCATEMLDVMDCTLALAGAGGFVLLKYFKSPSKRHQRFGPAYFPRLLGKPTYTFTQPTPKIQCSPPPALCAAQKRRYTAGQQPHTRLLQPAAKEFLQPAVVGKKLCRQPSSAPVRAPSFVSTGWDTQVSELLGQLTVTSEYEDAIGILARDVERVLSRTIPGVKVSGFTFGNPRSSKAFGVAVPEVDIVITISSEALLRWFQHKYPRALNGSDIRKTMKAALRVSTDRLVSSCRGFKFRRSAFRGEEPKVTLLAPICTGGCATAIPVEIYINAATPLRSWTLLSDCTWLDTRAQELVLLVRRWARDRAVSHVPKGHLSPYGWSLLTIFFLQLTEASYLLPTFRAFPKSKFLAQGHERDEQGTALRTHAKLVSIVSDEKGRTVADLFKDFFRFYSKEFKWSSEVVSIRHGQRHVLLAGHHKKVCADISLEHPDSSEALPHIEDPFDTARNVCAGMTADSIIRMHTELHRSHELCLRGASLAEFLEPWAPPPESGEDVDGTSSDFC